METSDQSLMTPSQEATIWTETDHLTPRSRSCLERLSFLTYNQDVMRVLRLIVQNQSGNDCPYDPSTPIMVLGEWAPGIFARQV